MRTISELAVRVAAGANLAVIALMLLVGYSDRLNPVDYPMAANLGLLFPGFIALNVMCLVFWLMVRKRMAIIPFAGLLAGFGPIRTYTPLNITQDVPEDALKVMSYNVYNFSTWDDFNVSNGEILSYIERESPDLLCLQEPNATGTKLKTRDEVLGGIYPYIDTLRIRSGSMIMLCSKLPIIGKHHIDYDSESNLSGVFVIKTGDKDTTLVVANHLESTRLTSEDKSSFKSIVKGDLKKQDMKEQSQHLWHKLAIQTARRAPQADAVAEYVRRNKGKSILLMGDFNDSPISYARHVIASELNDCYVACGNGPGISYHYNGFYVRIDHVMCSDDWQPCKCKVDNSIKASDHYPIICWLKKRQTH